MEETIFTKIIKGDISSHKVYEDAYTLAFLDIFPETKGHTLVIPKVPVEFVWDLPSEEYTRLMHTTQKIAKVLREKLGTAYVGSKVVGTDVPHAHVHLLPFDITVDGAPKKTSHQGEPDHEALATLAAELYFTDDESL